MLNWIFWNRTVYLYKMDLALNNLQRLICHKTQTNKLYMHVCMHICKQRWMWKVQTTRQTERSQKRNQWTWKRVIYKSCKVFEAQRIDNPHPKRGHTHTHTHTHTQWRSTLGAMPIVSSVKSSRAITYSFRRIKLGKVWNALSTSPAPAPGYRLDSITPVLLQQWRWHKTTHEGWYANPNQYIYIYIPPHE